MSEKDAKAPGDSLSASPEGSRSRQRVAEDPEFLELLEAVLRRIDRHELICFARV